MIVSAYSWGDDMEMDVLLSVVREWDRNNNGYINYEDFKVAMLPLLNS